MIGQIEAVSPLRLKLANWLDGARLEQRLHRSLPLTAALTMATLAIPYFKGFAPPAYLSCALLIVLGVVPFALREPPESRRTFVSIWLLALMLRLILLVTVFDASLNAGGPFLGPDSNQFLSESQVMADQGFKLGAHPIAVFETYDVAHYYIYAFLIRAFGADLFALQLFNTGLTAIAAALMFSVARIALPRWAVVYGLVVAINPSLMVLSIKDLLKDPSIMFAVAAAVWAVVHMSSPAPWSSRVAYGAVGSLALSYIHMDRFYVAAYFEIAAAVLLAVLLWRAPSRIRLNVLVPLVAVFVICESVPMAVGWPSTPSILVEQVRFVSRTRSMLVGDDEGLAQRALRSREELRAKARRRGAGRITTLDDAASAGAGFGVSMVKRLFGPFIWIAPPAWTVRELLRGDYMLYPGTLVWYFVLPLAAIGCAATLRRIVQRKEAAPLLVALTAFCVLYFLQFLVIKLSYRQRDVMFPFWALFAFIGVPFVFDNPRWTRLFAIYWIGLAGFAVAHLILRAFLA